MDSLANTLRQLRIDRQLPLRTVAAFLDIDQAILSKIERGQRKASREHVLKLADYFKVNTDDLLVAWLSDKLVYEIENEELALKALQVAEEKITYQAFTKIDRKKLTEQIAQELFIFDKICKAWLFGSFARGDDNYKSDIDLLIDIKKNEKFTFFDLSEIQEVLEKKINRKVDVVMINGLKPEVKRRINDDLKLIYEA